MKSIIILFFLTIPFLGICQEQVPLSFGSLEDRVLFFSKKEKITNPEIAADLKALNKVLETDIGENDLRNELSKYDYVKDSAIFFNLVATRGVELTRQKNVLAQKFIAQHPDSYVALYQLSALDFMYTSDSFNAVYESFSDRLKKTVLAADINAKLNKLKKTPTGTLIADFTRKNQYGKSIKLSDYRGKLVLLDFWGSWCVPCRQTHPHLKELYGKYKSKGLEIVAVAKEKGSSLSERQKTWLGAIKKDEINWVHVLADEGTGEKDLVSLYGINGYPTKVLIDHEGKVLMRVTGSANHEMDQLIEKLLTPAPEPEATPAAVQQLELKVEMTDLPNDAVVYLHNLTTNKRDLAHVKNHSFSISTPLKNGDSFLLQVGEGDATLSGLGTSIYLEPGKMNITGNGGGFKRAQYSGDDFAHKWEEIIPVLNDCEMRIKELDVLDLELKQAKLERNEQSIQLITNIIIEIKAELLYTGRNWLDQNLNSGTSVFLLESYLNNVMTKAEMVNYLRKFTGKAKDSEIAKNLLNNLTH